MNKYYIVTIVKNLTNSFEEIIKENAYRDFLCTGIEEFNLEEARVDEILGERSYSGGDVPSDVLEEVESVVKNQIENEYSSKMNLKFYFENSVLAKKFSTWLKKNWAVDSLYLELENQDWNSEWKKHYHDIEIDKDFKIVPSWKLETKKTNELYIYPGMGFGTGSHETTFLCLKLFKKFRSKTDLCLDFGCGSGILGLATFLFNEKNNVDFYDIDEAALENTQQNIKLNQFEKRSFRLLLPKNKADFQKEYDLVFANILQNILLENAQFLATSLAREGMLILSGLLKGQETSVIEELQSFNPDLKVLEVALKNDWVAVIMKNI